MTVRDGWIEKPLREILLSRNVKSKQIQSSQYQNVGTFPVVDQSSNFICGYHDDERLVISEGLPFTVFGDHTRHTKYVDFPFIAGADGTQVLKPTKEIDEKFFFYLVSRAAEKIGNFGYDRHFKHLKEFTVQYPLARQEQAQIAKILSVIDKAIEQTEAIIAKQQRIKTGLMQDLLTRGIDEHGNIRSEETHGFKDSPLGRIPVEWEARPLDGLVDDPITYGIVQAGPYVEGGVPYIRTGDMGGDFLCLDGLLRTSPVIAKAYKRSEVSIGDIVLALRATVGKVLPVPLELNGANLTQGTAKISPKASIDSVFLLWALRSSAVANQILIVQKGTTFSEITLGDLRSLIVAVPSREQEQQLISAALEANEERTRMDRSILAKLRRQKAALMQDLLTGKVRVTGLIE